MKAIRPAEIFPAIAVGVFYYWLYVSLVGVAAAIHIPPQFIEPFQGNPGLAVLLISLATILPAGALGGFVAALLLVKVVPQNQLFWAWAIIVVSSIYNFVEVAAVSGLDVATSIMFPPHMVLLPGIVAWWFCLPLSVHLLRKTRFASNPSGLV